MSHNIHEVTKHISNAAEGLGNAILSIMSAGVGVGFIKHALDTKDTIAWGLGCMSACIAMLSGIMAIRYYYYSTKKVKNEINKSSKKSK